MAQYLGMETQQTMYLKALLAFVVPCLLSSQNLAAEVLRDPTQLPSSFLNASNIDSKNQTNAVHHGPVLQSVMLSDDVSAAIINGQKIHLGERYNQSKLIALTENSATLRNENGNKTVLKMSHMNIKSTEDEPNSVPLVQPKMVTKDSHFR